MREIRYEANESDGKEILRILESSAAKGNIELIYTRRPDAYASYMKETGEAKVYVSKVGDKTIGTCAELIREVYIGGKPCKTAYICGLKKDAAYSGNIRFGSDFIHGLQQEDVGFYYCSVILENRETQKMFEKKRKIISMAPITEYKTYIFNPRAKIKAKKHTFSFRQATENDISELINFLNREGKKRDLFPVIRTLEQFYNLRYSDFYILLDGEEIIAAAALWNQTEYKQYVVKKYRRFMKMVPFFNPLLKALGYISLPKEDKPLNFPMLSFFVCKNDDVENYKIFLNEIRAIIARTYKMYVIGVPKNHYAISALDRLPSIHFTTKLYEIRFPWSEQEYKMLDVAKVYLECGLL